jgi:hypothetical protein
MGTNCNHATCEGECRREKKPKKVYRITPKKGKKSKVSKNGTVSKVKKVVSLPTLIELCQKVHNQWIRLRDAGKPCICCKGRKSEQAGHYYPVGSYSGVRFDEVNTNGQSEYCNCSLYGNLEGYKAGIIRRHGAQELKELETRAQLSRFKKWDREELADIIKLRKSQIVEINKKAA